MSDDIHEVYAVRYAHHSGRNASMNFIGGDPHQASQDLAFYVWAIVGPHGTIVACSVAEWQPEGETRAAPADATSPRAVDCVPS